ncbi:ATP-binding cassette domain-containing protein [Sporolactobacillus pectinivorans]|uniref:ATP-binding cassette domain-containing protein n=1 Tax=Sporolactobacillus pectinivorans TaxID=1591408 RepID=UPI000C269C4F|nr:ATP-binding cassette domain-containing protein [Sporolactobacillus pectinivorans]
MSDPINRPILSVRDLNKRFGKGCAHCRKPEDLPGLNNRCPYCGSVWACIHASFDLYEGEILGIVGESGSGKSTLVRSLYFDAPVTSGTGQIANFKEGRVNIFTESAQQKRYIKNYLMGMVYQNPWLGLKMDFSSGGNIAEKLIAAGNFNVHKIRRRASELLEHVEIPLTRMDEKPVHFSGGMQQRVQISKALANSPSILLLDEVTTGLDLSVQARVLDLIRRIQRESHTAMIVVSHDLGVIRMLSERTIVMKQGRFVESGLTDQILEDPHHPYTQLLVQSLL